MSGNVRVHALEPAPAAYAALVRNVAACPHVTTYPLALRAPADAQAGTARLHYYAAMPGESTFWPAESAEQQARLGQPPHSAAVVPCAVTTLSTFMRDAGIERVALLKIDVEGDELGVLQGLASPHDWRRIAQAVLEVHDIHGRKQAILALLRQNGFAVTVRAARSQTVRGYRTVVPAALRLFVLYARRRSGRQRPNRQRTRETAELMATTHNAYSKKKVITTAAAVVLGTADPLLPPASCTRSSAARGGLQAHRPASLERGVDG